MPGLDEQNLTPVLSLVREAIKVGLPHVEFPGVAMDRLEALFVSYIEDGDKRRAARELRTLTHGRFAWPEYEMYLTRIRAARWEAIDKSDLLFHRLHVTVSSLRRRSAMIENARARPVWRFTRHEVPRNVGPCKAWREMEHRWDATFWLEHFPPCGWLECACSVRALRQSQAKLPTAK